MKVYLSILLISVSLTISSRAQNWFPAEVGNKTLQRSTVFDPMWGNTRRFYLIGIERDTLIENQKYYLVQNSNYMNSDIFEEKWFRFDPDSQKIFWRVLDTSVVYMDFNLSAGEQIAQYNPLTGLTKYVTVIESSRNLFGNTYSVKGFDEWEFSLLMRKWIDGFGIEPLGINDKRIEQVLQFSGDDTLYFEYGYGPDFTLFSPILEIDSLSFKFDFWVNHFYTQNNGSVLVDFIESVYFECYYKSETDSIPAGILYSYYFYYPDYPVRRVIINLNSTLLNNGYSFYYKVIAKDKGLIPKYGFSPNTGYYKLNYNPTGLTNDEILLNEFTLFQNFPNPFNPVTIISYQLPLSGDVTLKVYDVLGREVETLVDEYRDAGYHEVKFNSSGLASGIYYYQLKAGSYVQSKKMVVIR